MATRLRELLTVFGNAGAGGRVPEKRCTKVKRVEARVEVGHFA
jgi:hypothetical protein